MLLTTHMLHVARSPHALAVPCMPHALSHPRTHACVLAVRLCPSQPGAARLVNQRFHRGCRVGYRRWPQRAERLPPSSKAGQDRHATSGSTLKIRSAVLLPDLAWAVASGGSIPGLPPARARIARTNTYVTGVWVHVVLMSPSQRLPGGRIKVVSGNCAQ
jgi:hypothetical protein